jgi:acid phosphatase
MKKFIIALFIVVLVLSVAKLTPQSAAVDTEPLTRPVPQHIVLVVEENHNYSDTANPANMPYLNSLAARYSKATQMYANTHPSIGNYFELATGNIITNNDWFSESPLLVDNIGKRLTDAGKTWKVYAEDLPSVGYTGPGVGNYAKSHNPFAYLNENPNHIVPFSQFNEDLSNNTLPNFSFVIPNLINDAHDGTLAQADSWLKTNINPILSHPTFRTDGLLIVTFDEASTDSTNGGGNVLTVFAGRSVKQNYNSTTFYQHQSLLRLIAKDLSVGYPGDAASAPDMDEFFK